MRVRESAHVIETAGIPGFSDKRQANQRPRKFNVPGKRRIYHRLTIFTPDKNAGEVEPAAVNSHLLHPPFQTVNDETRHQRVVANTVFRSPKNRGSIRGEEQLANRPSSLF